MSTPPGRQLGSPGAMRRRQGSQLPRSASSAKTPECSCSESYGAAAAMTASSSILPPGATGRRGRPLPSTAISLCSSTISPGLSPRRQPAPFCSPATPPAGQQAGWPRRSASSPGGQAERGGQARGSPPVRSPAATPQGGASSSAPTPRQRQASSPTVALTERRAESPHGGGHTDHGFSSGMQTRSPVALTIGGLLYPIARSAFSIGWARSGKPLRLM